MFLRAEPAEPVAQGDSLQERVRLDIQIRPLIGWTSAEGGFRGLYYNEGAGSLSTHLKITADNPGFFLGDVCEDETPTVRGILLQGVFERGEGHRKAYAAEYTIELTKAARKFFEQRKLPTPRIP